MRRRGFLGEIVPDAGHDANDLHRPGFIRQLDVPAERVLTRPELLRQRLINDRDMRAGVGGDLDRVKLPAAQHGQPERFEIIGADNIEGGIQGFVRARRIGGRACFRAGAIFSTLQPSLKRPKGTR